MLLVLFTVKYHDLKMRVYILLIVEVFKLFVCLVLVSLPLHMTHVVLIIMISNFVFVGANG